MNILFLSQIVPFPPHGGVLQRGYNIIKELSKDHSIYLLAFVHNDILTSKEKIDESKNELLKICKSVNYFDVWPKKNKTNKYLALLFGLFSKNPFGVIAYKSKDLKKEISKIIKNNSIDLIHFDTISLAQYYNKSFEVSMVVTHHNIESELMKRRADAESNFFAKLYLYYETNKILMYEKRNCQLFDKNITVSSLDAKKLNEITSCSNAVIIPNGVDVDYFLPNSEPTEPSLIYTGGMNMYANKDAVMSFIKSIFPLIKKEIPNVKFYAIGQDPPNELKRMSEKDKSIIVTGYVEDVRPYISKASVYVVPIRVGGGTRLKVLDAMAMGKAIVSTSIGCEGIDVMHNKNIIIEDDFEKFAVNVIELLQNPEKRTMLGQEARSMVSRKYSWDRIGEKLNNAYRSVLK